ncbi:putative low affinity immunoglobulin epsilon Fc receptor [Apostichopus japonicus]|uniref:Putative low affinity immunoglobulin epsilon Fc receptor n=1 Tax=Stichopus japonicus TaxID=307972 RepID=A0A2G8JR34_STIJA|nr:putative low affinity immunoglobulin epsilon Fc receptor [Apostichopus japonicus]
MYLKVVFLGITVDRSEDNGIVSSFTGLSGRYHSAECNWNDANGWCQRLTPAGFSTARLASVHSQDEQDFLYNYWVYSRDPIPEDITYTANTEYPGVWIGLNDVHHEGTYKWTDNTPFDFHAWLPHEPNNCCNGEDAVHFWDGPGHFGRWNDVAVNTWLFPAFCEIKL